MFGVSFKEIFDSLRDVVNEEDELANDNQIYGARKTWYLIYLCLLHNQGIVNLEQPDDKDAICILEEDYHMIYAMLHVRHFMAVDQPRSLCFDLGHAQFAFNVQAAISIWIKPQQSDGHVTSEHEHVVHLVGS